MDTNNVAVEGQDTQQSTVIEEVQQPTIEQFNKLQEENAQLKSNKERLLKESQRNKEGYLSMKTEKEKAEQSKLEAAGDIEALLEAERLKVKNFELTNKQEKNRRITQALKHQVLKLAPDACFTEDIITNLPKDGIDYDEATDSFLGLNEAIEGIRQTKINLFKKEPANAVNQMPSNMSMDNGESTFDKEIEAATTQREYDAVLVKYGKK